MARGGGRAARRREAARRNKYNEVEKPKTPSWQKFNATIERLDPDLYDERQWQLRADALAEEAAKLEALQPDKDGSAIDPRSFLRLGPPGVMGAGARKAAARLRPHGSLCVGCQQIAKALKRARGVAADRQAQQRLAAQQAAAAAATAENELAEAQERLAELHGATRAKEAAVSAALEASSDRLEEASHELAAAIEENRVDLDPPGQSAALVDGPSAEAATDGTWGGGAGGVFAAASAMLAASPRDFKSTSPREDTAEREREARCERRRQRLEAHARSLRLRQLELQRRRRHCEQRERMSQATASPRSPASRAASHPRSPLPPTEEELAARAAAETASELQKQAKATDAMWTAWEDWISWRWAKAGGRRGGMEPRQLRLLLQREPGVDVTECVLTLPREHGRVRALKAEEEAAAKEVIHAKNKATTEARAARREARREAQERARQEAQRLPARNKRAKQKRARPPPEPEPEPEPEPQPEPESEPSPRSQLSISLDSTPADVERLLMAGKHTDAMSALRGYMKNKGSVGLARAVARAAAGGDAADEDRAWLQPPSSDWRVARREEKRRKELGTIRWGKLRSVDTQGCDKPFQAERRGQPAQAGERKLSSPAAEGAGAGAQAAMLATQDLSEALPGVDPMILQHLSAAWRSAAVVGEGA